MGHAHQLVDPTGNRYLAPRTEGIDHRFPTARFPSQGQLFFEQIGGGQWAVAFQGLLQLLGFAMGQMVPMLQSQPARTLNRYLGILALDFWQNSTVRNICRRKDSPLIAPRWRT